MLKKDLLKLIEGASDDQDINSLLTGTDIEDEFSGESATLDTFKQKIKSDKDFKAFFESENDKYYNKALDTWKKNNLEKELEPFIQEKYPDLITDPTQKKLIELEKQLADEKAANARKDLLTEAIKYANEKKIPVSVVDKFLGEDIDKTKTNLDAFESDWSKGIEAAVNEKIKSKAYVPGGTDSQGNKLSIGAKIAQQNNKTSAVASDPWAAEK